MDEMRQDPAADDAESTPVPPPALGASPVRTAAELPTAVVSCFAYGDTALIERFIEGTEIAVSVVDLGDGPCALPAVEIVPAAGQSSRLEKCQPKLFCADCEMDHIPP